MYFYLCMYSQGFLLSREGRRLRVFPSASFFVFPSFLKEIPVYEEGETFLTSPERYTPDGKNREFSWRSFSEKPHLQGIKIKNHVLKRKTTKKIF